MSESKAYWLVELVVDGSPPTYYTAPGHWHGCADLATKFHTRAAARAEAKHLQVPRAHRVVAREHLWCPPWPR